MGVAKNIKALRVIGGLTQQQLADIVGVKREAVAQWEVGLAMPRLGTAVKLARHFGIGLDDLVGDDMPEQTVEDLSDALSRDERELVELYRSLDVQGREMALCALRGMASHEDSSRVAEGIA